MVGTLKGFYNAFPKNPVLNFAMQIEGKRTGITRLIHRGRYVIAVDVDAVYPVDDRFLAALEEGMPPSSGNALGLDRLIALALGQKVIGDVLAFPEGFL